MWEEMFVPCTYLKVLRQRRRGCFYQGLNSFSERTLEVTRKMLRTPLLDMASDRKYKKPVNLF
jgi:hypothetical protein